MVSFKWLFVSAAAVVSVIAQDPTGDATAAAAFWNGVGSTDANLVEGTPSERRSLAKEPRNTIMKDPYAGRYCPAPYTEPPCETKCNRNNCFRAFLNARDGSDGKHCPAGAFGFCCAWNFANPWYKFFGVQSGLVFKYFPFTDNCKSNGDYTADVVAKINDVCGCTLNHEVTIDVTSDYYALRYYGPYNPKCH